MWMGISTNGIGKISMPVAPSTSKISSKDDAGSFANIMELSSSATSNENTVVDASKQSADYSSANDGVGASRNDNNLSNTAETSNKYEEQSQINDKKSTDAIEELSTDESKDSLKNVIKDVVDKLFAVLEEKLGCTEQDIEDALENMCMMLQDLLVPNNLRDFVLQMNNATEVDLLINEQLPNLVSDIQNAIVSILESYGVTAEEVTDFLENLASNDALTTNQEMDTNVETDFARTQEAAIANEEKTFANLEQKIDIVVDASEAKNSNTNADSSNDQSIVAASLNQALGQAMAGEQVEAINDFQGDVAQADIIRQVVEAVRVNLSSDHTSMTLQLNPENLGRVQISVIQKNGIMQAQIIAENEAAKNAIEGNLALLQESLDHQELKVESVEVMIASYEFFNQQEQQSNEQNSNQTRRQSNVGSFESVDEVLEDEVLEDEIMRAQGNSVNYSI